MKIKNLDIDMKKIGVGAVKFAVGAFVAYGAGYVITKYGHQVIPETEKTLKRFAALAGTSVLAALVGEAASDYTGKTIDSVLEVVDTTKQIAANLRGGQVIYQTEEEN